MLAATPSLIDSFVSSLRQQEFSRLDRDGLAYLDYTGSALYADRLLRQHHALLDAGVFGNPHSESEPSRTSTSRIALARSAVLRFLDADPARYTVCFTGNATGALKLVAESYPFSDGGALVLSTDNHNSVNGIREYARRGGTNVSHIPLDDELRLVGAAEALGAASAARGPKLFAFPAQSNFSGVQHPLSLIGDAQALGFHVLVDAAAFVPTNRLSLREHAPEFVAVSFYKIFGYPTGIGALVVRRDVMPMLSRPWFAGGTVDFVSVQNDLFSLKHHAEAFEDGTPDFLNIAALPAGFAFIEEIGMRRIHEHVMRLTRMFLDGIAILKLPGGAPLISLYGPHNLVRRGGTVTFNVLSSDGRVVPFSDVERRARDAGIAVRGGCFCNPGAAERSFGFEASRTSDCLRASQRDNNEFSLDRLRDCLGHRTAVGGVRVSFGVATSVHDVERVLATLASFSE